MEIITQEEQQHVNYVSLSPSGFEKTNKHILFQRRYKTILFDQEQTVQATKHTIRTRRAHKHKQHQHQLIQAHVLQMGNKMREVE
jgi:hypothetical protein